MDTLNVGLAAHCGGSGVMEMSALVVGPDEWLVLSVKESRNLEEVKSIREQIPDALKNRVLIVEGMDVFVIRKGDAA